MQTPFPFESMLLFGSLAVMLLIGVLLRAKIPFFQKFLIPSCLIGGILGLILINIGVFQVFQLSSSHLKTFAYHFFNISFISVGLTRNDDQKEISKNEKRSLKGPLWMALTQTAIFPLQAIVGGLFVILFGTFGLKLFPTFGFFVPLGFEEGPGQALSFGKIWEGFGFEYATTIGLTFAAIGFFFSFFVGVPLVNWGIRKGLSTHGPKTLPKDFLVGIIPKEQTKAPAGRITFHSGNVDSLAFQAALVGFVYILTYTFVFALLIILGKIVSPEEAKTLWGFFFIFGLGIAYIIRWLMSKFGIDYLADSGIQRRITGWSIDFTIVSTLMAIEFAIVWNYILPISVISLAAGILTTLAVVYLGKRIWSYNLERIAAVYGAVTGTVPCGLLLLRIVDPDFKTPVAIDIALMNVFSIIPIGVCIGLVNFSVSRNWNTVLTLIVFLTVMVVALTMLRIFKLWGSPKF